MLELDALDQKAAAAFPGHIVRKDLVRRFRGQFPVPTYVVEFMLGRYCASTDAAEIEEGLAMVQSQLSDRTVRAGEEELFKARARERGSVRIIDIVTARLDAKSDSYFATLPGLRLTDVRIDDKLVSAHERMLTGGFYAEIELGYDASVAQEKGGRPFQALSLREIQLSSRDILDKVAAGRAQLSTSEWKDFLLRSVGLEPATLSPRAQDAMLLRMVPFVESNYNMVELGPRGTGKSHLFQQVSPYAHLVSGGKATVARMFVNMANGQRGLVCQYDVVCFDEVSGRVLRPEGRREHHEGVHGERASSRAGAREHPGGGLHRAGGQLRRGRAAAAAQRGTCSARMPAGDAQRHGVHGPHPLPTLPGLGHSQGQPRLVYEPLRYGQRRPR